MIEFKYDPNLGIERVDAQTTHISQKKAFFTSPEEIFGYMLYLFRKNLGFNQEQMGIVITLPNNSNKRLSKSGYAKLERGESGIQMQLLFDLSFVTGIHFYTISQMYTALVEKIARFKEFVVIFHNVAGIYGMGTNASGYLHNKSIGTIKETYAAKIKSYEDVVGKELIEKINETINAKMHPFVRDMLENLANEMRPRKNK